MFCFKKFFFFFLCESQPAGPITNKKGQCRIKKSKKYQRYGRYIKELVRKGGIIMDFIGVRKSLFNH